MAECFLGGVGGAKVITLTDLTYNGYGIFNTNYWAHIYTLPSGLTWGDIDTLFAAGKSGYSFRKIKGNASMQYYASGWNVSSVNSPSAANTQIVFWNQSQSTSDELLGLMAVLK